VVLILPFGYWTRSPHDFKIQFFFFPSFGMLKEIVGEIPLPFFLR